MYYIQSWNTNQKTVNPFHIRRITSQNFSHHAAFYREIYVFWYYSHISIYNFIYFIYCYFKWEIINNPIFVDNIHEKQIYLLWILVPSNSSKGFELLNHYLDLGIWFLIKPFERPHLLFGSRSCLAAEEGKIILFWGCFYL